MRVWDLGTGAEQLQITGHTGNVKAVAWSADSTRLAAGSDDATLRTWNARSGQADGFVAYLIDDGQSGVFDAKGILKGATPDAWRWIFWSFTGGDRGRGELPAEAFGVLRRFLASASSIAE